MGRRELRPGSLFQFLEQLDRHVVISHIDFTAAIAVYIGNFRSDRQISHLINNRFRVVPVSRAALKNDTFVNDPIF